MVVLDDFLLAALRELRLDEANANVEVAVQHISHEFPGNPAANTAVALRFQFLRDVRDLPAFQIVSEYQLYGLCLLGDNHIAFLVAPLVAEGLFMRVDVSPLPFLEKLYLRRLDRAIVKVKFQLVRDEDSVDGLAENVLVKFLQIQHLTASSPQSVSTDVLGFAVPPADFSVAIPMLHQPVMPVGSGHALHIVCAAVPADDFRRETAGLDHAM